MSIDLTRMSDDPWRAVDNGIKRGEYFGDQIRSNRLAKLATQGLGAEGDSRNSIIARMTAINPSAGQEQAKTYASIDKGRLDAQATADEKRMRLAKEGATFAKGYLDAKSKGDTNGMQGYQAAIADFAQRNGQPVPDFNDPTTEQKMHQVVAMAAPYLEQQDSRGVVVGSSLIDPRSGKVMYQGERQQNRQLIQGADGQYYSVDPMNPNDAQPVIVSGGQAAPQVSAGEVEAAAPKLGGGQWTPQSMRGQVNEWIKGLPTVITEQYRPGNAGYGVKGTAHGTSYGIDLRNRTLTPAQSAQIVAQAKALGWDAEDVRTPEQLRRHRATAPHIHIGIPQHLRGGGNQVADNSGSRGVAPRIQGKPLMGMPKGALTQAQIAAQERQDRRDAIADQRWQVSNARADRTEQRAIEAAQNKGALPPMSAGERKDAIARRTKVPMLQNSVRGLNRIDAALAKLSGGMVNTGPLDQYWAKKTPEGQELESAVNAIQDSLLALTRVPGIGSQSDLEARIAAMKFPSLEMAPSVNKATMKQLRAFVSDLARTYSAQIREDDARMGGSTRSDSGGAGSRGVSQSDAALLKKYGL